MFGVYVSVSKWHYINGVTDNSAMRYKTSSCIDTQLILKHPLVKNNEKLK